MSWITIAVLLVAGLANDVHASSNQAAAAKENAFRLGAKLMTPGDPCTPASTEPCCTEVAGASDTTPMWGSPCTNETAVPPGYTRPSEVEEKKQLCGGKCGKARELAADAGQKGPSYRCCWPEFDSRGLTVAMNAVPTVSMRYLYGADINDAATGNFMKLKDWLETSCAASWLFGAKSCTLQDYEAVAAQEATIDKIDPSKKHRGDVATSDKKRDGFTNDVKNWLKKATGDVLFLLIESHGIGDERCGEGQKYCFMIQKGIYPYCKEGEKAGCTPDFTGADIEDVVEGAKSVKRVVVVLLTCQAGYAHESISPLLSKNSLIIASGHRGDDMDDSTRFFDAMLENVKPKTNLAAIPHAIHQVYSTRPGKDQLVTGGRVCPTVTLRVNSKDETFATFGEFLNGKLSPFDKTKPARLSVDDKDNWECLDPSEMQVSDYAMIEPDCDILKAVIDADDELTWIPRRKQTCGEYGQVGKILRFPDESKPEEPGPDQNYAGMVWDDAARVDNGLAEGEIIHWFPLQCVDIKTEKVCKENKRGETDENCKCAVHKIYPASQLGFRRTHTSDAEIMNIQMGKSLWFGRFKQAFKGGAATNKE